MSDVKRVTMTCMTTKQKFEAEEPTVVILKNGRYAYKAQCPWVGKAGKELFAFKFCGAADYEHFSNQQSELAESEHSDTS